ncbi:MAG: hypothetical protein ACE5EK_07795 [Nitrospinales bacterium]
MSVKVSIPKHGEPIVIVDGKPVPMERVFQDFLDDLVLKANVLESFTVVTLPPVPPAGSPALIYVSDETGGAVPAFSDGTNWRRITDRAVVS